MANAAIINVVIVTRIIAIWFWCFFLAKKVRRTMLAATIWITNRVIINFKQDAARTDQVLKSIEAMIDHGNFSADTVIVDGFKFTESTPEDLQKFKDFAQRAEVEVWFSASLKGDEPLFDDKGIPNELTVFLNQIDVCITLGYKDDHIRLCLVKDFDFPPPGDLGIKLDPKTLLISR